MSRPSTACPAGLVKAVIKVESNYREGARSRKGAMGLMQLMPETARRYAVANPYEPRANIEAGIKYLKSLLERFELPLALAAYNAGEAAVRRFGGIPPYPETQTYVRRVLRAFCPRSGQPPRRASIARRRRRSYIPSLRRLPSGRHVVPRGGGPESLLYSHDDNVHADNLLRPARGLRRCGQGA